MRTGRPPLPVGTFGEIHVRRVDNGKFVARTRFRDFDGKIVYVSKRGLSRDGAKHALKQALSQRAAALDGALITGHSHISVLVPVYNDDVATRERLAPSTRERYTHVATTFIQPGLGSLRVRELNVPTINRFLATINDKHGHATQKVVRSVLSGMMQLAIDHGAIQENPVRHARRVDAPAKTPSRALTRVEHVELLRRLAADPRSRDLDLVDLVSFLSATGVRIGEAMALRLAQVDLADGVVEIAATVTDHGIQESTKTDAGWRILPLPADALEMLRRRVADPHIATHVVLFPSASGKVRNRSNTTGDLRRAFDRIGFDWVNAKTFRKTVATRLDEAGISARQVADQLGHANPSMTTDVYMGRRTTVAAAASILAGFATPSQSTRPL